MKHALQPYAPSQRHLQVHFAVDRQSTGLDFAFSILGARASDLGEVILTPLREPEARERRDEIWKKTCLEIFVGPSGGRNYLELNLCPSGDWNLYYFDQYREGMRPAADASAPLVEFDQAIQGDRLTWRARLASAPDTTAADVAKILASPSLVLGATAVIEYQDGSREYWALAHVGEKPDFHLRESFRLIL